MGCHPLLPERISMKLGIYSYTGGTTHVEIHVVLRQRGLGEHVTSDMLRFLIVQCFLWSPYVIGGPLYFCPAFLVHKVMQKH